MTITPVLRRVAVVSVAGVAAVVLAAGPTTAPGSSSAVPDVQAADDGSGSGAGWLFGGVLIGVVLLGGIVLAARRRLR